MKPVIIGLYTRFVTQHDSGECLFSSSKYTISFCFMLCKYQIGILPAYLNLNYICILGLPWGYKVENCEENTIEMVDFVNLRCASDTNLILGLLWKE